MYYYWRKLHVLLLEKTAWISSSYWVKSVTKIPLLTIIPSGKFSSLSGPLRTQVWRRLGRRKKKSSRRRRG
jgi:hypothetical protein